MKAIDLKFIQSADAAAKGDRVRGASLLMWSIVILCVGLIIWSNVAYIDAVTKGQGKVIPSSSVQTIQNLEGGIISEILVSEGDLVEKGEVLVVFDDTQSAALLREELARKEGLQAMLARLDAESKGHDEITFPKELLEKRKELIKREIALFEKRRIELHSRYSGLERSRNLAYQQLSIISPVAERRFQMSRQINDITNQMEEIKGAFQQAAMEEFNQRSIEYESLLKNLEGREDRVARTTVRSPVKGTVNDVHIKTLGGVVQPGAPLIDIVPANDTLLVEAKIRPEDIGFLHPGQKVMLKFTAYDFSIYGGLEGQLERISADTILDEISGEHFYQITVRNQDGKLIKDGTEYTLIPGMIAEVDILTAKRTVFGYLTKPFHRMRLNALRDK